MATVLGALLMLACGLAPGQAPAAAPSSGPAVARAGAALPPGITRGESIEGVTEYRLANGLQVLLFPDATKPTVTVNITYKVGSRMERYGETGMAHLLEHLMFKGSNGYPKPVAEFSRRGFITNGSTSFDRTNYFSTFPATDENLRWSLGQQADAMVNSFIARKDLDSEMTVVRNEFEMDENEPFRVLMDNLHSAMFRWHNYGKTTIGSRSDIENVDIAHLQAFYRLYYQPDNAVLVVAGRFDEARVLAWIARTFGRVPRPARTLPPLWTVEPVQDGERSVTVRRKGDTQIVLVGYHVPAARSREAAALSAAVYALSDTPTGRLHHELVEKGIAAQVLGANMDMHDSGVVMFGAIVKPGDSIERARDRLIEVVETSFAGHAPTETEMARLRSDYETINERALENPQGFGISLSGAIGEGDWRLFFLQRDEIAKVTGEQAADAARRYFRRDNRTVALFLPEDHPQRAEVPAPIAIEEMLRGYHPRTAVAAGELFDPSQDSINARTQRLKFGTLELALLPRKTRGSTVTVAMAFRFGDESSLQGRVRIAEIVAAMMDRGTTHLTREQINDEILRLKFAGGPLSFQTTREKLPGALHFAASLLRESNFPQEQLEQLRGEWISAIQSAMTDPAALAADALARHFNTYPPGDPRYAPSLEERLATVKDVSREDLLAYHRDFWGTARGQVAIVGDFDPDEIAARVTEEFGDWRSPAPYARVTRELRPVAPSRILVAAPDKENAVYRARLLLDLRDDDADAPALMLANEVLGGGFLHSRLADRIRQKEGLSYGIDSRLSLSSDDRVSYWGIHAIAAPQNMARVESAVREEIERLLRDGVSQEELDSARNGLLQLRLQARTSDGSLAGTWVQLLDHDRTFSFSKRMEEKIRGLTPASMMEAVRRHLDPAGFTVVVAGDPAKGLK
jgi:zinc protease